MQFNNSISDFAALNLILYKPGENCPEQLLVTTSTPDGIYINDDLVYVKPTTAARCFIIMKFDTEGQLVRFRGLAGNGFLGGMDNFNDRIFIGV